MVESPVKRSIAEYTTLCVCDLENKMEWSLLEKNKIGDVPKRPTWKLHVYPCSTIVSNSSFPDI